LAAPGRSTSGPEETPNEQALASLVLSHTPSYHATTSRLTSLNDLPIPDASLSANLITLIPRLERARDVGKRQEREVAKLEEQSSMAVGRWHEVGVVGMGECWSEWETRLTGAELAIRREQARRKREGEAT